LGTDGHRSNNESGSNLNVYQLWTESKMYMHTAECHSTVTRTAALLQATSRVDFQNMMLCQRAQSQNTKQCDSICILCPEETSP
jgi:hypothetical protein